MPRPDMLTEERHNRAVEAFSQGASVMMCCDCIGISESTYYGWRDRAKTDRDDGNDTKYTQFMEAVKKARYKYEMSICKEIERQGFDGRWQANAWLLERRNPKSFASNSEDIRAAKEMMEQMKELKIAFDSILSTKSQGDNNSKHSDEEHEVKRKD